MRPKEMQQHIERSLLGKLTAAILNVAQIEELLPHWDGQPEENQVAAFAALGAARKVCQDMLAHMVYEDEPAEGES